MINGFVLREGCVMAKYLVVANQTVGNPRLLDHLQALGKQDDGARFVLLVPATRARHLLGWAGRHDSGQASATRRADKARDLFRRHGIHLVEARSGPESPVDAVEEVLRVDPDYAAVVVSTLPGEISRWQRDHVPKTIESRFRLPVYHVTAPPAWTYGP